MNIIYLFDFMENDINDKIVNSISLDIYKHIPIETVLLIFDIS